jgi:D-glycero-D-manno-heptose 1,7-bisphosphate phosphatase
MKSHNIESSWTIFLDRDGVINEKIVDGYVRSWDDFSFINKAL